jgi:hypothetical protein
MLDRILGVFKLDVGTFESIEHDESATGQAFIVVLLAALLSGVGSGLLSLLGDARSIPTSFISGLIAAVVGWLLWSAVSWFVGTSFFGGKATLNEMLRVLGFATAPQMLGVIPCIGPFIGWIWSLIAGFIAIRQGLDLDNTKAFLTALIGIAVVVILNIVIWSVLGIGGAILGGVLGG